MAPSTDGRRARLLLLFEGVLQGRVRAPRAAEVCRENGVPDVSIRRVVRAHTERRRRAAAAEAMHAPIRAKGGW